MRSPNADQVIIHLELGAPHKPPVGYTCNGCGVCCALETCPIARIVFLQRKGPCPALEWSQSTSRYHCGLLVQPERYLWLARVLSGRFRSFIQRLMSRSISEGSGCDCTVGV